MGLQLKSMFKPLTPKSGMAHVAHLVLLATLPPLLYIFAATGFSQIAVALILLSKWRMFMVKPRHWLASIRANATDLIVGFGVLVFMVNSASTNGPSMWQLVWAVFYGIWLLLIKPNSSMPVVSLQAVLGQLIGLVAIFMNFGGAPSLVLVVLTWIVCFSAARHFLMSFDEPLAPLFAHAWGYFGAALTWVLGHWLLYYGVIAQPMLLLSVIGLGLATLYYLDKKDRLSPLLRRQFIFVMVAVVAIVLAFSDWGDKTV